ncbi:hypothetical protein KPL78_23545 [Roseomonas sp. HJA6]|uniref:Uncharacterized protein n=1 Tax=Roseomonas alba TaxID=2846776 RepID=A0ABS7AEW9_9PROT|nr:hypothetical protein [Neoroseomonas alba]MBW6400856.1 hypothetical protein [Neoroseomonas alba]
MTIARIVDELRIRFDNDGEAFAVEDVDLDAWQAESGLDRGDVLDALGLHLARGFASRTLDFDFCDRVVNAVIWHVWLDRDDENRRPDLFCAVFEAFEAGEGADLGDPMTETAERDTRPLIDDILGRTRH